jgi:hypothetical protein
MRTVLIGVLALTAWVAGTVYAESRTAMPRVGKSCPSGDYRSGQYCMAGSESAKPAITRQGSSCPSGYYRSGDYCVQNS